MSETESNPVNLVEGLTNEILRVTEIQKIYLETPGGQFAAVFMLADIQEARKAQASGDVLKMVQAYKALKEYEL